MRKKMQNEMIPLDEISKALLNKYSSMGPPKKNDKKVLK